MRQHTAGVLAAVVLAVGVVGAVGGVAAATDPGNRTVADTNETAFDSENRSAAASNDTLAVVGVDTGLEGVNGAMLIDCTGEALTGHDCEKGGVLDLEAVAIDYDGAMGGPITDLGYWFDDHIVVYVAGLEAAVEFSCEMGVENVRCPTAVDLNLPDDVDTPDLAAGDSVTGVVTDGSAVGGSA